jgi:hypothetical protein
VKLADLTVDLELRDTPFNPFLTGRPAELKTIQYNNIRGQDHYRVWIHLAGVKLPFVDEVTYRLHESFKPALHRVVRGPANPICALEIWTWGLFEVSASVRMKTGEVVALSHMLTYDKQFKAKGVQFVSEP